MIKVENYSFSYKNEPTLDKVNFESEPGNIYAIVGPNGSGKTTFLKSLVGLIPSSGEITINNNNKCSTFLKNASFQEDLEVNKLSFLNDEYAFYKDKKIFNNKWFKEKTSEYNLYDYIPFPRKLSRGNAKLLYLIYVLSFNKDIYILDEPISNIDNLLKFEALRLIQERVGSDKIVILSSHELIFIEDKVDKIIFLDKGKILSVDDIDELKTSKNMTLKELFYDTFGGSVDDRN